MICVSVGEKSVSDVIAAIDACSFAEVRLDMIHNIDARQTREIFSSKKRLIATFRNNGNRQRLEILSAAAKAGAAFIDTDIGEDPLFITETGKICGCSSEGRTGEKTGLIISYHNYSFTPGLEQLDLTVERALEMGADVVKIACSVNTASEAERLLSLPDYWRGTKVVIAGMGPLGSRVRILSDAAGSYFTYASCKGINATAGGQLDYETLLGWHRRIRDGITG